jgi:hypothetical protein
MFPGYVYPDTFGDPICDMYEGVPCNVDPSKCCYNEALWCPNGGPHCDRYDRGAYPFGDKAIFSDQMAYADAVSPFPNAIVFNWATIFVMAFGNLGALDLEARCLAGKESIATGYACTELNLSWLCLHSCHLSQNTKNSKTELYHFWVPGDYRRGSLCISRVHYSVGVLSLTRHRFARHCSSLRCVVKIILVAYHTDPTLSSRPSMPIAARFSWESPPVPSGFRIPWLSSSFSLMIFQTLWVAGA